jgi:ATP-dependent RNA helicase RhlE
LPAELKIEQTPPEEKKTMLLEIDNQKKRDDPTFKGAFHEKKKATQIKIAKAESLKIKKQKETESKYPKSVQKHNKKGAFKFKK